MRMSRVKKNLFVMIFVVVVFVIFIFMSIVVVDVVAIALHYKKTGHLVDENDKNCCTK